MRYAETDLLTAEQAKALLAEMDRWCRRTGTNYHRLVTAARVAPNTRAMIRQGKRRPTCKVADRIRAAMKRNPGGIDKQRHLANRLAPPPEPRIIPAPIPDRSPCPRCGTRGDIGCAHRPVSVPMQTA
jgi:hypothetical protein